MVLAELVDRLSDSIFVELQVFLAEGADSTAGLLLQHLHVNLDQIDVDPNGRSGSRGLLAPGEVRYSHQKHRAENHTDQAIHIFAHWRDVINPRGPMASLAPR